MPIYCYYLLVKISKLFTTFTITRQRCDTPSKALRLSSSLGRQFPKTLHAPALRHGENTREIPRRSSFARQILRMLHAPAPALGRARTPRRSLVPSKIPRMRHAPARRHAARTEKVVARTHFSENTPQGNAILGRCGGSASPTPCCKRFLKVIEPRPYDTRKPCEKLTSELVSRQSLSYKHICDLQMGGGILRNRSRSTIDGSNIQSDCNREDCESHI